MLHKKKKKIHISYKQSESESRSVVSDSLQPYEWASVAQLCLTLCDPMNCVAHQGSIHGIFQARILEWVAISFSRRSLWPRDWTQVSRIVGRHFTVWATREVLWIHGILQARRLEWVTFPFSRDLLNPWIKPRSLALQADSLPAEPQVKSIVI